MAAKWSKGPALMSTSHLAVHRSGKHKAWVIQGEMSIRAIVNKKTPLARGFFIDYVVIRDQSAFCSTSSSSSI